MCIKCVVLSKGPFLGNLQSWTVDPRVKKGSSPHLLCVACLWNPKYPLLEHKYGRNQWKMSKIGQNSMKKWPFFAIILPWMARYGSKRSFLLIFSARDDLVKVSWKSDVGKCQNQLTPPYFDQLSERHQPLWWAVITSKPWHFQRVCLLLLVSTSARARIFRELSPSSLLQSSPSLPWSLRRWKSPNG